MKKLLVTLLSFAMVLGVLFGSLAVSANGDTSATDANIWAFGAMEEGVLDKKVYGDKFAIAPFTDSWVTDAELSHLYECQETNGNIFIGVKNIMNPGVALNLNIEELLEPGIYHFKGTFWTMTEGNVTYLRARYDESQAQQYFFPIVSQKTVVEFYFTVTRSSENAVLRIMKSANDAFNVPFAFDDISLCKVEATNVPEGATLLAPGQESGTKGSADDVKNNKDLDFDFEAIAPGQVVVVPDDSQPGDSSTARENVFTFGAMEEGVLNQTMVDGKKSIEPYAPAWAAEEEKTLASVYECKEESGNVFIGVKNVADVGVRINLNTDELIQPGIYCFKGTFWTLTQGDVTYLRIRYNPSQWQDYFFEVTSQKREICYYLTVNRPVSLDAFLLIIRSADEAFATVPFGFDNISLVEVSEDQIPGGAPYLSAEKTSAGQKGERFEAKNQNPNIDLESGTLIFNNNGIDPSSVKEEPPVTNPPQTQAPAATNQPPQTQAPTVTNKPTQSQTPATTDKPVETQAPTVTDQPAETDGAPTTDAPTTAEPAKKKGCSSGIASGTAVFLLAGVLCAPVVLRKKDRE